MVSSATDEAPEPPVILAGVGALPHGLLSLEQLQDFLGMSKSTVNALRSHGKLPVPAFTSGRLLRWSALEVAVWAAWGCPTQAVWRPKWVKLRGEVFRGR